MARPIVWPLVADPRKFNKGFKEAGRTADVVGRGIKRTAGLIGGAFAGIQVAGFLKGAIDEAREAAKVGRQTAAVIKATGGVANVSAKDVDRLSTALSNKVGVDDEVIAAGQNMLLTFKNVRSETGKGNDIFQQTTRVALDMTAALHQGEVTQSGLEQTTMRLGKALNDPIKGISALTRVGVTFTDAQKEQIKTLVEAGDTMGAQKIILRELATEFGGAAEAAADPWSRLKVTFDNVKEAIGTALLPALNNAASFITDKLIPAAESWWKRHGPAFRNAFKTAADFIDDVWTALKDNLVPWVKEAATRIGQDLKEALDSLEQAWRDNHVAILQLGKDFKDLKPLWDALIWLIGRLAKDEIPGLITQIGWIGRAFHIAKGAVINANKAIFNAVIGMAQGVLRAMKAIVDSVPGGSRSGFSKALGRGIDALGGFRDRFNRTMDGLKNEDVTIDVKGVWVPPKGSGLSMHDIVGRARGGPISGPGTTTSDSIPAWLSTGEHVWSAAEVRGAGGHQAVEAMRREARGFAVGGKVDPNLRLPSTQRFGATASGAIGRLAAMLDRLSFKVPIKGNPSILSFIRSVDPLPYVWGGVGPGGYDCSGLVGEVLNRHLGLRSYVRRFTTASIHAGLYGLKSGLGGMLNIGVTPGRGHMAGSYMGMGFEAESTRTGIKVGSAASSPGSFARTYHLARGGPVLAEVLGRLGRTANIGGDPGRLRINGRVMDGGGWLRPGWNPPIYNGTGRPERVLPPGAAAGITVNIDLRGARFMGTAADVARDLAPHLRRELQRVQGRVGVAGRRQVG